MSGFAEAFGTVRGARGEDRDTDEALAALSAHQPCENALFRVVTDNGREPVCEGERALYCFLVDADGKLLAVSSKDAGALRLPAMPAQLARRAGIENEDTIEGLVRVPVIRRALDDAFIYNRKELLAKLEIDEAHGKLLCAIPSNGGQAQWVLARNHMTVSQRHLEVLRALQQLGLIKVELVGIAETRVKLTADGLLSKVLLSSRPGTRARR